MVEPQIWVEAQAAKTFWIIGTKSLHVLTNIVFPLCKRAFLVITRCPPLFPPSREHHLLASDQMGLVILVTQKRTTSHSPGFRSKKFSEQELAREFQSAAFFSSASVSTSQIAPETDFGCPYRHKTIEYRESNLQNILPQGQTLSRTTSGCTVTQIIRGRPLVVRTTLKAACENYLFRPQ